MSKYLVAPPPNGLHHTATIVTQNSDYNSLHWVFVEYFLVSLKRKLYLNKCWVLSNATGLVIWMLKSRFSICLALFDWIQFYPEKSNEQDARCQNFNSAKLILYWKGEEILLVKILPSSSQKGRYTKKIPQPLSFREGFKKKKIWNFPDLVWPTHPTPVIAKNLGEKCMLLKCFLSNFETFFFDSISNWEL